MCLRKYVVQIIVLNELKKLQGIWRLVQIFSEIISNYQVYYYNSLMHDINIEINILLLKN